MSQYTRETRLIKYLPLPKCIPDVTFSIKETRTGEDTSSNYIWVNGNMSPVSIILSIDRMNDYYPAMVERTTLVITKDNKFYFLKDGAFYSVEKIEE